MCNTLSSLSVQQQLWVMLGATLRLQESFVSGRCIMHCALVVLASSPSILVHERAVWQAMSDAMIAVGVLAKQPSWGTLCMPSH